MSESTQCYFSKVFIRTKIGEPVFIEEVDPREIILSNYEKIFYIKDLDGNLLAFLPWGQLGEISDSKTWSSEQITNYITNYLLDMMDVIDGGTF